MQTYKLLKNGIIDSQFCSGEEKGNKVEMSGECRLPCFSLGLKNLLVGYLLGKEACYSGE